MLYLIIYLLFGIVTADDFKLAAVALLKNTAGTAECIKTAGDIEYWVNMATGAAQATRIIATGGIVMPELTVNGPVTLGRDTGTDKIDIKGALDVTGAVSFDDISFNAFDLDTDGSQKKDSDGADKLEPVQLRNVIKQLEYKIAKLCAASSGTCD
jgi:hypothetical protein